MLKAFREYMTKRCSLGYPVVIVRPGDWEEAKRVRIRRGRKLRKALA